MRAVVQRVIRASVEVVEAETRITTGAIEKGIMALVGVQKGDTSEDIRWMAEKLPVLRIFPDEEGKFTLSLMDVGGAALVVSNFTLFGDCRKGRRPSFTDAAGGEEALSLYEEFLEILRGQDIEVKCGRFGEHMEVTLVNDGPVTLMLDSRKSF